MAGLRSLDTRAIDPARRREAFERFVGEATHGAVWPSFPGTSPGGHISVSTALSGARSGLIYSRTADPCTYQVAAAPHARPHVVWVASGSEVTIGDNTERFAHNELIPIVSTTPVELRTAIRSWILILRPHADDMRMDRRELEHLSREPLTPGHWQYAVLHATALSLHRGRHLAIASHLGGGIDRFLASTAELLLHANSRAMRSSRDHASKERRAVALQLIEQRFHEPDLTPASIAADLGLSVRQLNRAFTGTVSITTTITRKRLEHARSLLQDPTLAATRISQIAIRSGYSSATTFTRAYKRRYGLTPTEERTVASS
ncbi:AraC-like DNA-binding protein [Nocardioides sp. BE266]|uniref:AraC family transcriptional regulator n=1 Tax=Nocardioides sp. BE266 TaxID=2817725 RepID=UPI00285E0F64|nr:AraC family transcriptional regulator [Nocardioides sp. BE266]MDR7255050.1 AraC-like DNA-binding protein [Nocardioides sp. BE266]